MSSSRRVIIPRAQIAQRLKGEGCNLVLVSCGGVGSTTFRRWLEKAGYRVATKSWKRLVCHAPWPIDTKTPTIFLYGDPVRCFSSMRRRARADGTGPYCINVKKMRNNMRAPTGDRELLRAMERQYRRWTKERAFPADTLLIKQQDLYSETGRDLLREFLALPVSSKFVSRKARKSILFEHPFFTSKRGRGWVDDVAVAKSRIVRAGERHKENAPRMSSMLQGDRMPA